MLRFFKSKLLLLIIVTIGIFIAIGLSANQSSKINWFGNIVSVPLAPFQKFFAITGEKVEGTLDLFKDITKVKQENEELKAKVDQLEKERMDLIRYKDEIKELKAVLNFRDQFNEYDFMGANIIAKDLGNWFDVFSVDRGSNDGIRSDFPVITSKGLVGKVSTTWPFSSKIISIIDEGSTVSAILSKTRDYVLVKGDITLKNQGLCRVEYIPSDVDISVGDTVETSGIGGIFPKGIIIGTIKEIKGNDSTLNRYAIISTSVDFKRLEEVIILKSKNPVEKDAGSTEK